MKINRNSMIIGLAFLLLVILNIANFTSIINLKKRIGIQENITQYGIEETMFAYDDKLVRVENYGFDIVVWFTDEDMNITLSLRYSNITDTVNYYEPVFRYTLDSLFFEGESKEI